jgi:hypothetical protein
MTNKSGRSKTVANSYGPWFRFFEAAINDPKVQSMPGDLFKAWINILCLANMGRTSNGALPEKSEISFHLRVSERDLDQILDELITRGLIQYNVHSGEMTPHNWIRRQYRDRSRDRMRAFRSRQKRSDGGVTRHVTAGVTGRDENVLNSASDSVPFNNSELAVGHRDKSIQKSKSPGCTESDRVRSDCDGGAA